MLYRHKDVNGISGVGHVAEGVEFSDGRVAMRWIATTLRSTGIYDSLDDMLSIHGHDGRTEIHFTDGLVIPSRTPLIDPHRNLVVPYQAGTVRDVGGEPIRSDPTPEP